MGKRKPCNDCPFMKSSPMNGSPEWLKDVLMLHDKSPYFRHTCHKTDPNADGYTGTKAKVMPCQGHLEMMMNEINGTPGKNGTYLSIKDMGLAYINTWQRELDQRRSKKG